MNTKEDIWNKILEILEQQYKRTTMDVWFDDAIVEEFDREASEMILVTSNDMKRDVITKRFMQAMLDAANEFYPGGMSFRVMLPHEYEDYHNRKTYIAPEDPNEFNFQGFVVGPNNRFAYSASVAVSNSPGIVYNPLFIWGPSGLGKTHLLNAISNDFKKKFPGKKTLYFTSETFTNELIEYLQAGRMPEFRTKYRAADILLVDDIQFIGGKESTQEEFFNTFNALYETGKQIVLTSDRPPHDIQKLENRLRSRFEMGLLADIKAPEYETRCAIVSRKADALKLELPTDVAAFIAENITDNVRQLEGVVKKINALHSFLGEPVGIECAQRAINDIFKENPGMNPTADFIIEKTALFYGMNTDDVTGTKRAANIAQVRHIAVYLTRMLTKLSLPEIGTAFGNRDHSTISNSINRIEVQVKEDPELKKRIDDLIQNIREG